MLNRAGSRCIKKITISQVIYATYDQGSTKFVNHKPPTLVEQFWSFSNAYALPIGLIIAGIAVVFMSITVRRRQYDPILYKWTILIFKEGDSRAEDYLMRERPKQVSFNVSA